MVTVDAKGRIVILKDLRERLMLGPRTEVTIRKEAGHLIVEPVVEPEINLERLEALVADATADRSPPADGMHPIAIEHSGTIRRQAADG